jgi:hypothetical protein
VARPRFDSMSQRLFLVQLVVAVGVARAAPLLAVGLPMLVFALAALTSLRNVAVASIVLMPGMAASMPSARSATSHDAAAGVGPVLAW